MPAKRSRTLQWRRCLHEIRERGGSIEVAVNDPQRTEDAAGHLIWRVRVLDLDDQKLTVELPTTLGQPIPLREGVELIAVIAIGQNRWMFNTYVQALVSIPSRGDRVIDAVALSLPEHVERCQRRSYYRVDTAAVSIPGAEVWPLLDPKSVIVAERANEIQFENWQNASAGISAPAQGMRFSEEDVLPEVGPRFHASVMNVGGGGVGLRVPPDDASALGRHKVFWLRISLMPDLPTPICATAKLAHTHMESSQHTYAGMSFDFTFNPGHQKFVVDQICRYIAIQQQRQFDTQPARRIA